MNRQLRKISHRRIELAADARSERLILAANFHVLSGPFIAAGRLLHVWKVIGSSFPLLHNATGILPKLAITFASRGLNIWMKVNKKWKDTL